MRPVGPEILTTRSQNFYNARDWRLFAPRHVHRRFHFVLMILRNNGFLALSRERYFFEYIENLLRSLVHRSSHKSKTIYGPKTAAPAANSPIVLKTLK